MKLETVKPACAAVWRIALSSPAVTFTERTLRRGFSTGGLPILALRFFIFIFSSYLQYTESQALFLLFFDSASCQL